jgi:hypothetical protein
MNFKNALCVAAAGLALSGCAWLRGWHHEEVPAASESKSIFYDGKPCERSPCKVEVTVEACHIDLDPNRLGVRHGLRDAEIVWEIRSPGYTFAKNGISFREKEMTRSVFRDARVVEGNKFTLVDANAGPGTYKYTVRIMRGEKACAPLDPEIVNDM